MSSPLLDVTDLLDNGATVGDVEQAIAAEDRTAPSGRPWLYTNMIQSADGATAVDGLSGGLGGPADLAVLLALRSCADVILVGSSTAQGEGYSPPDPSQATRTARRARGQAERPLIAVVSGSLRLRSEAPLFADPAYRPRIFTTDAADPADVERLSQVADVVSAGTDQVSPHQVLDHLNSAGASRVLLEGGPTLNGQFVSAGLVDEWNITISPVLVSGTSKRPAHGGAESSNPLELARLWTADGLLLCRYLRR